MSLEFIFLGGYGQFVWPAFIFTIASCFFLYLKTKKELQTQEKMFLSEYKKLHTTKIRVTKQEDTIKEALLSRTTF